MVCIIEFSFDKPLGSFDNNEPVITMVLNLNNYNAVWYASDMGKMESLINVGNML